MKIISWNCSGKFREKQNIILQYDADIYIIQECENPKKYKEKFMYKNYTWYGLNNNKGLCIFAKDYITLQDNHWENYGLRHFMSVKINNSFDLLCIWTGKPYIEEYYVYQQIHKTKYSNNMVIMGDFNSNAIWDKKHKERSHSNVAKQLSEIGLVSAYHFTTNEQQGKETKNTFYMHRDYKKPYHIDYCFANPNNIKDFYIIQKDEWLQYSDHIPIALEMFSI